MRPIALSTMWGIGRFPTLAEFFTAGAQAGFDRFELNHAVDSAMLERVQLNGHRIVSLHEPCPADMTPAMLAKRDWLISSLDDEARAHGVAAVCRTIDLAAHMGADAVVVHPGRVNISNEPDLTLRKWHSAGDAGKPQYAALRQRLVAERAERAPAHVAAVLRSLYELAEHATRRGVRLGLENRYYYHEIPLPDELETLLAVNWGGVVGFWYDVGHALSLDSLGYLRSSEWLERFSGQILGVHLHDVAGFDDHRPVGFGEVDWQTVIPYIPSDALVTCEFKNCYSAVQVHAGLSAVREKLDLS